MRVGLLAIALVAALGAASPVRADQTDKRLDALFAELHTTKDEARGAAITERIWEIWLKPNNAEVESLLANGLAAMQAEAFDDALAAFDRITELAPKFAEGWNRRATLRYMMGDYDGSVADIERTLALEPRHFGAISGLGLIYLKLGKEEAALKAFRRALEIDPFLSGARDNAAAVERRLKDRAI